MNKNAVVVFVSIIIAISSHGLQAQHNHSVSADICAIYNKNVQMPRITTVADGAWSDPNVWGGTIPGATENVIINHSVTLNQAQAGEVQVSGSLHIDGELDLSSSLIVCKGGLLTGSEGAINFHVENDRDFTSNATPGPVAESRGFHPEDNGLWVVGGGTVQLDGPEVTSWLDVLSKDNVFNPLKYGVQSSVAFANGSASLSEPPVGWQAGDQLLLVTEKGEHALAELLSVNGEDITYQALNDLVGNVLRVEDKFVYPKIANLSRRFQIVSSKVSAGDVNHRAHTAYLRGAHVSINYVEFRNLGPRGKLGRYPVHWHHAHQSMGGLHGSSIWQSVDDGGNRFVVPHIVNGITVSDNVGFRSQGHGYFMEEVMEFNNVITGNLSVDVRHGEELSNVDESISFRTHHFWLRESNKISGNVAAGNNWVGADNKWPRIEGLVLLRSSEPDTAPAVTDFECLGCGAVGMWTAVPDTLFENPVSAYATVAGYKGWEEGELLNPTFLLNGTATPWKSQVYANYGKGTLISGGVLAGFYGIHAHYSTFFAIDGTSVYGDLFILPTYWELAARIDNAKIFSDRTIEGTYPKIKKPSPGLVQFTNTCFRTDCNGPNPTFSDVAVTRHKFADFFDTKQDPDNKQASLIIEPIVDSGFIRLPAGLGAKAWSIVPKGSTKEPEIFYYSQNESIWRDTLGLYKGYMHGFPPGEYDIKLYVNKKPETYITSGTATVYPGLISEICLAGSSCLQSGEPVLVIKSPDAQPVNSGSPILLEGYANDLKDGIISSKIVWTSNVDGHLGQGSALNINLSIGSHRLTATITDSDGKAVSQTVDLQVLQGSPSAPDSGAGQAPASNDSPDSGTEGDTGAAEGNDSGSTDTESTTTGPNGPADDGQGSSADSGNAAGSSSPDSGTTAPASPDPGATAPASPDPGTTAPASPDPGTTAPASPDPGTTAPASPDPGTTAPASPDPGTTAPASPDPGTTAPASPDPGTTAPASPGTGTAAPASPNPGTTASASPGTGTAAPANPNSGTTAPDALGNNNPNSSSTEFDGESLASQKDAEAKPDSKQELKVPADSNSTFTDSDSGQDACNFSGSPLLGPTPCMAIKKFNAEAVKGPSNNGPVIFNSGVLRDFTNQGTVIGGTVVGGIDNAEGTLVNINLGDGAVVAGGRLTGSLTGFGSIREALLDLDEIDNNVIIGNQTIITEKTLANAVGLELIGSITNTGGIVNSLSPLLITDDSKFVNVKDMLRGAIDSFYGNAATRVYSSSQDGKLIIENDFLEGMLISMSPVSVTVTDQANRIGFHDNGQIQITQNNLSISLASSPVNISNFKSMIESLGGDSELIGDQFVRLYLDGMVYHIGFSPLVEGSFEALGDQVPALDISTENTGTIQISGEPNDPANFSVVIQYLNGLSQGLVPSPHNLESFQKMMDQMGKSFRINPLDGIVELLFSDGSVDLRLLPDYLLSQSGGTSLEAELVNVGDLNNDGFDDFNYITPGLSQVFFGLPTH